MEKQPFETQAFKDVMVEAIVSLPQDMKAVLRIVEDPDLEDAQRTLAAGSLVHVLSASNAIPGMRGTLAYVDDAIVLRLVLERLVRDAPEAMAHHQEDSPELFEPLAAQMETIRGYLGDLLVVLERAVDTLPELTHEGHTPAGCARDPDDSTWLYDAVHGALVDELEFDADAVERALRQVDQIRRPLEMRLAR
ncbi:MAG: hypothetical protein H6719_10780 [Sandaracinaceae bacterium]|nr:hypothetical protein [Sandaracinaceae bacterium]